MLGRLIMAAALAAVALSRPSTDQGLSTLLTVLEPVPHLTPFALHPRQTDYAADPASSDSPSSDTSSSNTSSATSTSDASSSATPSSDSSGGTGDNTLHIQTIYITTCNMTVTWTGGIGPYDVQMEGCVDTTCATHNRTGVSSSGPQEGNNYTVIFDSKPGGWKMVAGNAARVKVSGTANYDMSDTKQILISDCRSSDIAYDVAVNGTTGGSTSSADSSSASSSSTESSRIASSSTTPSSSTESSTTASSSTTPSSSSPQWTYHPTSTSSNYHASTGHGTLIPGAAVGGIIIGMLALICPIFVLVWWLRRRRNRRRENARGPETFEIEEDYAPEMRATPYDSNYGGGSASGAEVATVPAPQPRWAEVQSSRGTRSQSRSSRGLAPSSPSSKTMASTSGYTDDLLGDTESPSQTHLLPPALSPESTVPTHEADGGRIEPLPPMYNPAWQEE